MPSHFFYAYPAGKIEQAVLIENMTEIRAWIAGNDNADLYKMTPKAEALRTQMLYAEAMLAQGAK